MSVVVTKQDVLPSRRPGASIVVAIPANNEAERIGACLAALAMQRDRFGAPLPSGIFEVLVFANNCDDDTVGAVEASACTSPHPILVVAEAVVADSASAGWARKRAMDLAANRLTCAGHDDGLILTTDADSVVGPFWIDATRRAIGDGVDAVAGYIDAQPSEITQLGSVFVHRSLLEDRYLSAVAEIYALCDPRPHDPWPNHRVSSGASLAVTLAAYRAIGGLPPRTVGEDAALTLALEDAGLRVRHTLDVCVSTSCRLDGRAQGGAADTMRYRHGDPEAPCDDDLEPAFAVVRRALSKGRLRALYEAGALNVEGWGARFGLSPGIDRRFAETADGAGFETFWSRVVEASHTLRERRRLCPADLPHEIKRAAVCLRELRSAPSARQRPIPAGRRGRSIGSEKYWTPQTDLRAGVRTIGIPAAGRIIAQSPAVTHGIRSSKRPFDVVSVQSNSNGGRAIMLPSRSDQHRGTPKDPED